MPRSCAAIGCTNRDNAANKEKGITFHILPTNSDQRQSWLRAIRRKNYNPGSHHYLCSKHFTSDDFEGNRQRRTLKKGVTPSIFPGRRCRRLKIKQPKIVLKKIHADSTEPTPEPVVPTCQAKPTISQDHTYSCSSDPDALKLKCLNLQDLLELKDNQLQKLKMNKDIKIHQLRSSRDHYKVGLMNQRNQYEDLLLHLKKERKLLGLEGLGFINSQNFSKLKIDLMRGLVAKKKSAQYSPELKEFAHELYFYSSQAYEFIRNIIDLPAPSTFKKTAK